MKSAVRLVVAMALIIFSQSGSLHAESRAESVRKAFGDELAIIQTDSGEYMDVLFKLDDGETFDQLDSAGVIHEEWGEGLYSARVPVSQAFELGGLSSVGWVYYCEKLHLNLDLSATYIRADEVHALQPTGYTGRGVIIGIVDIGIDVASADLKNAAGRSRVLSVWDHRNTGTPPAGFNYGAEFDSSAINSGAYSPTDFYGHGTACAGIAAGSGLATGNGIPPGTYTGVAPDADIVAVVLQPPITPRTAAHAVTYIVEKAHQLNRPCVINLSMGSSSGPRDGTASLDLHVNNAVLYGGPPYWPKSLAIVVAAGNTGFDPVNPEVVTHYASASKWGHSKNHVRLWGDDAVSIDVQGWDGHAYVDEFWAEVFYPKKAFPTASFSLTVPTLDSLGQYSPITYGPYGWGGGLGVPGGGQVIENVGFLLFQNSLYDYVYENPYPDSYSDRVWIVAADDVNGSGVLVNIPSGNWTITGSGFEGPEAWDVYLYNQSSYYDHVHTLTRYSEDYKIQEPGCGADVITVGSINTKNFWVTELGKAVPSEFSAFNQAGYLPGTKSFFSSPGPSRNPEVNSIMPMKPEIYAPGAWIASTGSSSILDTISPYYLEWTHANDGVHVAMQGTSFAAPHVAGVIALMMEKNPQLTNDEIREALAKSQMANGCIDAQAAVNAVTNSIDPPPSGEEQLPNEFALGQNYPNPFNLSTVIRFSLVGEAQAGALIHAKLSVLNVLGRRVRTLFDEDRPPGTYEVTWDGCNSSGDPVASGIYFYKLDANGQTATKKMIMVK